jgi:hypothetical protein
MEGSEQCLTAAACPGMNYRRTSPIWHNKSECQSAARADCASVSAQARMRRWQVVHNPRSLWFSRHVSRA